MHTCTFTFIHKYMYTILHDYTIYLYIRKLSALHVLKSHTFSCTAKKVAVRDTNPLYGIARNGKPLRLHALHGPPESRGCIALHRLAASRATTNYVFNLFAFIMPSLCLLHAGGALYKYIYIYVYIYAEHLVDRVVREDFMQQVRLSSILSASLRTTRLTIIFSIWDRKYDTRLR